MSEDPEVPGWTAEMFAELVAAIRGLENSPLPPDAEQLVRHWPPRLEINLVGRPPAFIPYYRPAEIPASGHYSHAEYPWRCGRCGMGITAWESHQECTPGRFALPSHDMPETPALPEHDDTPELDV